MNREGSKLALGKRTEEAPPMVEWPSQLNGNKLFQCAGPNKILFSSGGSTLIEITPLY